MESASPDLNFLLLQNLIISPSIWIVFTIQILGEYSYSYNLLFQICHVAPSIARGLNYLNLAILSSIFKKKKMQVSL